MLLHCRQFRPDFFLPELNLFIEICGFTHMPYSRDRMKQKQALYEKCEIEVLFISIDKGETFKGKLEEVLKDKKKFTN